MKKYEYYNEDGTFNAYNVKAACREILQSGGKDIENIYFPNDLMRILTSDTDYILERMGVPLQKAAWIAARSRSAETENFELAKPKRKLEIFEAMARNLEEAMATDRVYTEDEIFNKDRQWNVSSGSKDSDEIAKAEPDIEPEDSDMRKWNSTLSTFVYFNAASKYSKFNYDRVFQNTPQLKELTNPAFLDYIGIKNDKDRKTISDLMKYPDTLRNLEKLKISGILRDRIPKSSPGQKYMTRIIFAPPQKVTINSSEQKLLSELELELKQHFCWKVLYNYGRADKTLRMKLKQEFGDTGPFYSNVFKNPELYSRFGLTYSNNKTYLRSDILDLHESLSAICRPKEESKETSTSGYSKILYTPKARQYGNHDNSLATLRNDILDIGMKRDEFARNSSEGKAPVYPPGLLRKVFNDEMLKNLDIDLSFEKQFSAEELAERFRAQMKKGEFPWRPIAATWLIRVEDGLSDNQLIEEQNRTVAKSRNLRSLMENIIVPLLDKQIEKRSSNVLSLVKGDPPEKSKKYTWIAGEAVDRKATEEMVAAKSLPGAYYLTRK